MTGLVLEWLCNRTQGSSHAKTDARGHILVPSSIEYASDSSVICSPVGIARAICGRLFSLVRLVALSYSSLTNIWWWSTRSVLWFEVGCLSRQYKHESTASQLFAASGRKSLLPERKARRNEGAPHTSCAVALQTAQVCQHGRTSCLCRPCCWSDIRSAAGPIATVHKAWLGWPGSTM